MSDDIQDKPQEQPSEQTELGVQPEQAAELNHASIDLTLRLLVGLLSLGGEEAAQRLHEAQRQLDDDPTRWRSEGARDNEPLRHRAWYLGVGLMKRGQKGLRRGLRQSYDLSLRAAGRLSSASDRWGVTYLTRPVRRPIEMRLAQWRREAAIVAQEGQLEDQKGRALAMGTLSSLILEILDEVAENPEMLEFVEALLGSQGKGMASSMMDNARSVTLTADDAADGLLRWLLRRTPRRELPSSPVEGQKQTMYAPTARVGRGGPDAE